MHEVPSRSFLRFQFVRHRKSGSPRFRLSKTPSHRQAGNRTSYIALLSWAVLGWIVLVVAGCGTSPQSNTQSKTTTQPVVAGALVSLSCSIAAFTGTGTDSCSVTLSTPASSEGLSVTLSSNNTAVTVPGAVTVPPDASAATFNAVIGAVSSSQVATLTAIAGSVTESFALTLNAANRVLSIDATSISFGDVDLNTTSTQSLELNSTGTQSVTVNAPTINGNEFSDTGVTFPVTLNPGQSATLSVVFDPTTAGAATESLTITSNATSGGTATISMSGTGVAQAAPAYEVELTWDPPENSPDPVAGYNVYRSASGGSYLILNSSSLDVQTAFADTTVQNGIAYSYIVKSVDNAGNESSASNTFSVTIPQL